MSIAITVIVPTLNAQAPLAALLAQLDGADVVVSDGGSTDGTVAVARGAGARVVEGTPGRGGQLARGAAVATGDWLLFLHADSRLPEGWRAVLAAHAATRPDRAAVFSLRFDSKGWGARLTAGWANLRTRLFGLPYGDQGLFVASELYRRIGGHADMVLMEDVEILRRLPRRPVLLPAMLTTSATRYEAEGWLRRGARNLGTLALYLVGVRPERLRQRYERKR